ncbi:MAG: metallophosphoesterase [Opitutales bacterium]
MPSLLVLLTAAGVVWLNLRFLKNGLLAPDFKIIGRAFAFNLGVLPALLGVVGLLFVVAATPLARGLSLSVRRTWLAWGGGLLVLALSLIGLRVWVHRIEPQRLVVRSLTLLSDKLLEPVRVLHLSDIQSGSVGPYEERIFEQVRNLAPDLILYTGDWLQPVPPATFNSEWPKMRRLLETLDPPLGIFTVYGDTDGRLYHLTPAEAGPLIRLGTEPVVIEAPGGRIHLRGLDLFQSRYPDLARRHVEAWLDTVPPGAFSLLMGHGPDFLIGLENLAIDLCLAGHTHGGQVRLPGLGPLVTQSAIPAAWSRGFHEHGNTRFHVSAGAGSVRHGGLPEIRFNCPTEMTLITLVPEP